jgi:hypothetical protein
MKSGKLTSSAGWCGNSWKDLVDAWRTKYCSKEKILELDRDALYLDKGNFHYTIRGFAAYIENKEFERLKPKAFHLGLTPVPYIGDLARARIFILMLNPGFGHDDYYAEEMDELYRSRLSANLRQENATDFPFMFLDPRFCWHGGYVWWRKRFGDLVDWIRGEFKLNDNQTALRWLSEKVASLELIPYHSIDSGGANKFLGKSLSDWPRSSSLVRAFAADLVRAANEDQILLIVCRRSKEWGIERESHNVVIYKGGHTRGAYLNQNSPAGVQMKRFLSAKFGSGML